VLIAGTPNRKGMTARRLPRGTGRVTFGDEVTKTNLMGQRIDGKESNHQPQESCQRPCVRDRIEKKIGPLRGRKGKISKDTLDRINHWGAGYYRE